MGMAMENGSANGGDPSQLHPSEIRVGDIIGVTDPGPLRYTVKMISEPQKSPGKWTFFGRDTDGCQHTGTFKDTDFVRRYAKAS
jgi:hypothetical protein